jgi:ADP-ribose pyrophosphatase YjhB (NUDIX family)
MPALGVCVVIIDNQGKIVLTKRNDLPVWCLPGGHVEDGESFVEAAIREAKEETGLEIRISRLVGIYSRPNWFDGNHEIVFAAQPIGGQLQVDNTETVEIGFFDLSALPQPLLAWNAAHIIDTFAEEQVVVRNQDIRFPMENITRRDLAALRKQDKIPFTREMITSLCTPLSPEKNRREIGE